MCDTCRTDVTFIEMEDIAEFFINEGIRMHSVVFYFGIRRVSCQDIFVPFEVCPRTQSFGGDGSYFIF